MRCVCTIASSKNSVQDGKGIRVLHSTIPIRYDEPLDRDQCPENIETGHSNDSGNLLTQNSERASELDVPITRYASNDTNTTSGSVGNGRTIYEADEDV